ncbi:MAG: fused MFS/spermidine synthase [Planctomycetota bacterium]
MSEQAIGSQFSRGISGRFAVGLLFIASGAAALMYELVWYQLLRYVVGASSVSLALTLASFMGGLGLGAYWGPRLISRRRHPMAVFAGLEVGIVVLALALRWVIPALGEAYAAFSATVGLGDWFGGVVARGVICALCLIPPAVLMGATLPAIARYVTDSRSGAAWLGVYYALNTLGATVGVLVGGFLLMPNLSLTQVTLIAAGLDAAVALWAWVISRVRPEFDGREAANQPTESNPPAQDEIETGGAPSLQPGRLVVLLIGIAGSGATAMGCQVIWTRLLSAVLSVTVYTFSIILGVFLLGLAVGGAIGGYAVRRSSRPGVLMAWTQLLLVPATLWAFWAIGHWVPTWRIVDGVLGGWLRSWLAWYGWFGSGDLWRFCRDLERVAWAIGPATLCWGASVPLAIAAGWGRVNQERGDWTGRVYAWNTAGAITGALGVGLFVLPQFGSATTSSVLIGAPAAVAAWLVWGWARAEPVVEVEVPRLDGRMKLRDATAWVSGNTQRGISLVHGVMTRQPAPAVISLVVIAGAAVWLTPKIPRAILYSGHEEAERVEQVYLAEGLHATAAVTTSAEGTREMWVSGKIVASSFTIDMRLQRMLGHLAVLAHGGEPKSVLIVGLGTGTTAGCFVDYPSIERIVVCEIEPRVAELAAKHFAEENRRMLEDPRTVLIADDARHYLATTDERFDIITSDPIHPWVRGAAALYSTDYYDRVKEHLAPGGVVTHWLPFYEADDDTARSMLATFFDAFPAGTLWHAGELGSGNDAVMLARPDAPTYDAEAWSSRWDDASSDVLPPSALTAWSEVEVEAPNDLLRRFLGDAPQLRDWLADAPRNSDDALRLEYLAGMSRWRGRSATDLHHPLIERRAWSEAVEATPQRRTAVETLWTDELNQSHWRRNPGSPVAAPSEAGSPLNPATNETPEHLAPEDAG